MSIGNWGGQNQLPPRTLERMFGTNFGYRPQGTTNPFLDYMQRTGLLERLFRAAPQNGMSLQEMYPEGGPSMVFRDENGNITGSTMDFRVPGPQAGVPKSPRPFDWENVRPNDWGYSPRMPIYEGVSIDDLRNIPSPTPEQVRPISRNGYPNQTPVPSATNTVQAFQEYLERVRQARAAAAAPVAPPPNAQTHPFGPDGLGWSPQVPPPAPTFQTHPFGPNGLGWSPQQPTP